MTYYLDKNKAPNEKGEPAWRVSLGSRETRQTWTFYGSAKAVELFEAQKKVERAQNGIATRTAHKEYDFATFCVEKYWPGRHAHLRKSTREARRYQLDALGRYFGKMKLTAITTEAVEGYQKYRAGCEGADGEPIQNSTINTETSKLQAVLAYAEFLGVPCAKPKIKLLPTNGKRRVYCWTPEQTRAFLQACQRLAPDLFPMMMGIANTAMRPGEAVAALSAWVKLERHYIGIEPNEAWRPKTNRAREVPISDPLMPILSKPSGSKYLFPRPDGERYARFPYKAFLQVRDCAGHADDCCMWNRPTAGPERGASTMTRSATTSRRTPARAAQTSRRRWASNRPPRPPRSSDSRRRAGSGSRRPAGSRGRWCLSSIVPSPPVRAARRRSRADPTPCGTASRARPLPRGCRSPTWPRSWGTRRPRRRSYTLTFCQATCRSNATWSAWLRRRRLSPRSRTTSRGWTSR